MLECCWPTIRVVFNFALINQRNLKRKSIRNYVRIVLNKIVKVKKLIIAHL
jgi:hypothetical protein